MHVTYANFVHVINIYFLQNKNEMATCTRIPHIHD